VVAAGLRRLDQRDVAMAATGDEKSFQFRYLPNDAIGSTRLAPTPA